MDNNELKLFNDGYSLQAYNVFGAHFENRYDTKGVVFRVYAPNAKSVRLVGDFNQWNKNANFLVKIADSVWEIFIADMQPYAQYKYIIETAKGELLEKADPFAFYNELRPGWVCKVVDLEEYKWTDEAWLNSRTRNFDKPMNIYEVHLGGFKHNADGKWFTYYEMIDQLIPYVKEMGYTHIELMPLNEYPFDGSWGYQQYGYFSVTSRYGNPYQLMMFIDACHNNGIGVIMDVVLAHFVKDAFGLVKFDGSAVYESIYKGKAESQWDTLFFDFGKPQVKSFLMSCVSLWFDKYHMDGVRVDAVSTLIYYDGNSDRGVNQDAIDFIKRMNFHLHQKYPNCMIIAEDSSSYPKVTVPTEYEGLGFDYKWDLGWMNDTLKYYKLDAEYRHYHHNLINFSMAYFYSEKFILPLSHDEVVHMKGSIVNKMWGSYEQKFAQARNLMTYMMTHPGKKLNFMGNELGTFSEFDEKKELDWEILKYPVHDSYRRMVRDLNNIYKTYPAFWQYDYQNKGFVWLDADNAEQRIFSYVRFDDKYCYVVVLNMSPVSYEDFEIGVPTYGFFTELFNSEKDIYNGCNMCNFKKVQARKKTKHNQKYVIKIRVAPFAGIIFQAKLR